MTLIDRLFWGRLNRRTYAAGMLLWSILVYFAFNHLDIFNRSLTEAIISFLIALFIYLSLSIRIMHDTDLSLGVGWVVIIAIGIYVSLYLYTRTLDDISLRLGVNVLSINIFASNLFYTKGQNEKNAFGKPPPPNIDLKALIGF